MQVECLAQLPIVACPIAWIANVPTSAEGQQDGLRRGWLGGPSKPGL